MNLQQLKNKYKYGLTPNGLEELIKIGPNILVSMKLRTDEGDFRPTMPAIEAKTLITKLTNGYVRELWIVD